MLIFSILSYPCTFLYYSIFVFFYVKKLIFCWFCNPCQSSPLYTFLVSLWFILSVLFFIFYSLTLVTVCILSSSFRLEESNGEKKKLEHMTKLKDKKIEALESRYTWFATWEGRVGQRMAGMGFMVFYLLRGKKYNNSVLRIAVWLK